MQSAIHVCHVPGSAVLFESRATVFAFSGEEGGFRSRLGERTRERVPGHSRVRRWRMAGGRAREREREWRVGVCVCSSLCDCGVLCVRKVALVRARAVVPCAVYAVGCSSFMTGRLHVYVLTDTPSGGGPSVLLARSDATRYATQYTATLSPTPLSGLRAPG